MSAPLVHFGGFSWQSVNSVGGSTLMQLAVQTAAARVDAPDAWAIVTSGPQVTNAASAAVSVFGRRA